MGFELPGGNRGYCGRVRPRICAVSRVLSALAKANLTHRPAMDRDSFEFSKRALETLREIMRAVPSVKEAFIFMIDQSLEKIIDSMSQLHVVHLLPILIGTPL